ncbi:synaptonemal complex central element protein 2 [Sardina pilchardus]|uniref:synaptonemal complex central element protein 2 n=1 Tax=Sardina pilchardus TaxID=27697 RepID=UPI002E0FA0F8
MEQHLFEKPSSPLFQSTPKSVNPHQRSSLKDADGMVQGSSEQIPLMTLDDSDEPQIEDSGIGASTLSCSSSTEIEDICSFPLNKTINEIGKKAQDLIERINHSRAMDQKVIANFEDTLMKKVRETCQELKDNLFSHYEEQSHGMEARLQELSKVLGRSSQLSVELQGASQVLVSINKGLQQTPEQ